MTWNSMGQQEVKHTSQQNVVVEWMNITLLKRARCMLLKARLLKDFQVEAVNSTYYLVNIFSSIPINCRTLEQVWSSLPSNYVNLRIFSYFTYAHVNEGKLKPRLRKCVFLGYVNEVKGYVVHIQNFKDMTNNESAIIGHRNEQFDV